MDCSGPDTATVHRTRLVVGAPLMPPDRGPPPAPGRRRGKLLLAQPAPRCVTILAALLLLPVLLVSAPPAAAQADEDSERLIRSTIEADDLVPGETARLVMSVSVPSDVEAEEIRDEVEITLPTLPPRVDFDPEEEVRRVRREVGAGNRSVVEIEMPLVLRSAGRAVIPAVRLDAPWGTFRTDPHLLEIPRSAGGEVPFDASWTTPGETVYVGQTVSLYLEVSGITEFVLPENVEVGAPSDALLEEVRGLGSVETRTVGGKTLYQYPAATYLFTPTLSGDVEIPDGVVAAQGLQRSVDSTELSVSPLPESVSETGAVGTFHMSAHLDPRELPVGESATLTVRVEGTGNLLFLQFPEVAGEGLVITETGTSTDVTPSEDGYRGSRTARYRVTPRESGARELSVAAFPYLEPGSGEVRQASGETFLLNSLAVAGDTGEDGTEAAPLELLTVEEIKSLQSSDLYRRPWFYLIALPPVLAIPVLAILRRRVPRLAALLGGSVLFLVAATLPVPVDMLEAGAAAFEDGDYPAARSRFMEAMEERPENAGIHYNLALADARAGRTGEAVFHLRESVRLAPHFHRGWEVLQTVEQRAGLERQVEPMRFPHPDYFAVILIALVYVAAVFTVLLWRTRRGVMAIVLSLTLGIMVLIGGAFAYSLYTRGRNVAVVSVTQAPITKIPDDQAQPWLSLPAGTAVMPVARYRSYVLIRTGYGVEGWTRDSDVIARTLPEGRS